MLQLAWTEHCYLVVLRVDEMICSRVWRHREEMLGPGPQAHRFHRKAGKMRNVGNWTCWEGSDKGWGGRGFGAAATWGDPGRTTPESRAASSSPCTPMAGGCRHTHRHPAAWLPVLPSPCRFTHGCRHFPLCQHQARVAGDTGAPGSCHAPWLCGAAIPTVLCPMLSHDFPPFPITKLAGTAAASPGCRTTGMWQERGRKA